MKKLSNGKDYLFDLIKGYAVLAVYVAHFFDSVSVLIFHKWFGIKSIFNLCDCFVTLSLLLFAHKNKRALEQLKSKNDS